MEALIVGLAGVVIGSLVAMFGVRVFFLLLPVWGFLAGFALGAQGVASLLDEGFLVTVLGWAAGLAVGVLFAILAGLWFWASILILAGSVGWSLVAGLLVAAGMEPGPLVFLAGLAGAAVLVVLAVIIDAPTLYVAVLTSFGGTAFAVTGALVVLGRVELGALDGGVVAAMRSYPLAFLAWLGLAVVALGYQLFEARGRSGDLRAPLGHPGS